MRHFKKRLKRDKQSKIIGGVCSGLAEYFEVDPIIPRLIFIVGAFSPYPFILMYIIMWIMTPYEKVEIKNFQNEKYSNE